MRDSFIVRSAKYSDFNSLLDLVFQIVEFNAVQSGANDEWYSCENWKDMRANTLKKWFEQKKRKIFVAEFKGRLVGYITYFYCLEGEYLLLDEVYIEESCRGMGIGKSLLCKVKEVSLKSGLEIHSEIYAWNKGSEDFHQKNGFVEDSKLFIFYPSKE